MSKPESIKIEPWTDFPRQSYSIITDDFCHEKLATVKVNAKSATSTVNVKASASENKGSIAVADEVKVWFQLPQGKALYTKIKSSNYIKVHYDHGVSRIWNKDWNLYASVNATKSLQNLNVRVGATHLNSKCHSDNRLKYDRKNYTWYNRTIVNHEKFTFGLLGAYGLTNNVLVKNNLFLGYRIDDKSSAYLRLENDGYRSGGFDWKNWQGYFDSVKVDFVSSHKGVNFGIQGVFNTRGNHFKDILAVAQHYDANRKLTSKIRVNSNLDVSLLLKFPSLLFKDIATSSVGFHGANLKSDKRSFKFGGQIEFNV